MRIGIDARLYSQSGLGRYIKNLISQLKRVDHKNDYVIFLTTQDYDNFSETKNFKKVLADFAWYSVSEQLKFPQLLEKSNLDLVHFPHFNVPVLYKGPFVVTIHDLIHQHFATRQSSTRKLLIRQIKKVGYRRAFGHAVSRSLKILTPSDFVKKQLVDEWLVDPGKITVTPEAVDDQLIQISQNISQRPIDQTLKKFSINPPFLFYLGNAQPHKNLINLIQAFSSVRKTYPNLSLVLSGPDSFFWSWIKNESMGVDNIIFTNFISDQEMVALYKSAAIFIMPSLEEGFGIPILEAMVCGCPVASSSAGSLKEVGGEAGIYFDPKSIDDMTEKILKILTDKKLKDQLIQKGLERYKQFSWVKMAKQTLAVYEKVAGDN